MNLILNFLLLLRQQLNDMGEKYPPDHLGNFPDSNNSYVVGIPLSASTVYLDSPVDNRNGMPLNDLGPRKRSNTSFQITSVTVQGSRTNDELDDSADDYDESHTDDISSDILDSSKITEADGYQSEDTANNYEDLSPCGPLIITPLSSVNDPNMNVGLGINMSPPFPAVASNMVSGGVTMMTSSAESPVSAQVPMINPLPDNWQHRFKVVKIVSSEPFKRGRWLCMDFRDPPQTSEACRNDLNFNVPAIQVTPCSGDNNNHHLPVTEQNTVAHVFGLPVNSAFTNLPPCQHDQPVYGILVPQQNYNHVVSQSQQVPGQNNSNAVYYTNPTPPCSQIISQPQGHINYQMPSHPLPNLPRLDSQNNNVPMSYQNLNGHNSVPHTGSAVFKQEIEQSNPVVPQVPVPPDKVVQKMHTNHVECNESAASSGASTVAIDNKIEQAMDLVKSHLMFAVREEVEVLKEKITELLERISQLEHENDILRANASPETLKQLNQSQKKFTGHPLIGKQHGASPHIQNQPPPS